MAASSPTAACGSGYHQIDSHKLSRSGKTYATIYLLYNGSKNCVVTWKSSGYAGNTTWVNANIRKWSAGGTVQSDSGHYNFYAGPRYVTAPNECVDWGGSYGTPGPSAISWQSGWTHCG
ncbi:serine/threonine protein kinase [Streptosporangium sp. 'caverna']|nr:serine/threonine protein kinase [Streptosporangium sp. 'caverna']